MSSNVQELKLLLEQLSAKALENLRGIPEDQIFEEIARVVGFRFERIAEVSFVKFHPGDPARVTFLLCPGYREPSSFSARVPFPYWSEYQPSLFGGL